MQLSQKREILSEFFVAFPELTFNFEHFQTKMNLTADVFFSLRTAKNVVR